MAEEILGPSDERFAMYVSGSDETQIEIEPPKYEQIDVCLWMVVNADPSEGSHSEHLTIPYDPLEQPNLHREFARIEIAPDPIIAFANSFGFLGRLTEILDNVDESDKSQYLGESLEDWGTQIFQMRTLTEIWDLYCNPNPDSNRRLADLLEISGDTISVDQNYVIAFAATQSTSPPTIDWDWDELETSLEDLPRGLDDVARLRMGARLLVRDAVNYELREGSYASIDAKHGSPIYLVPRDLRGALYVMFAQELLGQSIPSIRCDACGSYFVPEHGKQRYCDDRCKFKAYRQRKKEKTNG